MLSALANLSFSFLLDLSPWSIVLIPLPSCSGLLWTFGENINSLFLHSKFQNSRYFQPKFIYSNLFYPLSASALTVPSTASAWNLLLLLRLFKHDSYLPSRSSSVITSFTDSTQLEIRASWLQFPEVLDSYLYLHNYQVLFCISTNL